MKEMNVMEKKLKCSICGREITPNALGWSEGNNAEPVNSGRCCDLCNNMVVIPTRLRRGKEKTDDKFYNIKLLIANKKNHKQQKWITLPCDFYTLLHTIKSICPNSDDGLTILEWKQQLGDGVGALYNMNEMLYRINNFKIV